MSFQLNTATALPAEVQLGREKPQGAFALRSRYSLSANSASSWNAGTTLTLPLQTGTPGTFTDVKQGVIQATVQITNTNPYVDFLNFGPSGAMIFFDEMRLYSSGTPIEENLRYSETADLLMIQAGHQVRPFHMFRRNKWRAANGLAGDKHINFIKPSMVDSLGCPMFGRTPFMDNNSAVYQPPSISFGTDQDGAVYGSSALLNGANASTGVLNGFLPFYDGAITGAFSSLNGAAAIYAAGPPAAPGVPAVSDLLTGANAIMQPSAQGGVIQAYHRSCDSIDTATLQNNFITRTTQFGRTANAGAFAIAQAASYVPSQWPDFQPCTLLGEVSDEEIDSIMGKAKVAEYMKYLCNVRSLPIGIKGRNRSTENGFSGNYCDPATILTPTASASGNDESNRFLEYRVSMPFMSGIYGIFADKMFPDMLIGANNMRIEFKLAQNVKALWTTMDPCRRVPGTLRDFIPFTGSKSGTPRNVAGPLYATVAGLSAFGCSRARIYAPNAAIATDTSIVTNSWMYNTLAALGQDLVPTFSFTSPINVLAVYGAGPNVTYRQVSAAVGNEDQGFHQTNVSNLPKPQFVPSSAPWLKELIANVTYVPENAACFGTYLPASQAQSRRCWQNTKLNAIGDSYANSGSTYFTIRDIQYIGEQVQLDDVVTSAIIQSAATSEVVVWTRGYRSFEASCDQNSQQNIILPIQIGQAEALYLVFRPTIIVNSPDYYSNSFCCPFVGLSYTNQSDTVKAMNNTFVPDVGGSYTLNSSLDSAATGSFSYQLFSGTKQYPLQPIQTVSELITEREKSVHSLHNWDWCSTENMAWMNWSQKFGATANTSGLDLDPFLDFGYFTTFVPVFALDDQTITQNPYLQVVELEEDVAAVPAVASRIRGRRCPASAPQVGSNTFYGVLNQFTVPTGSFFLGWDFESWTNHQDVMRTGKFLGQEQVSVRMTGTFLCNATNVLSNGQAAQSQTVMCTAIVPHVVKLSFVPGGHLLSYY
jgi:hypothetical protein